MPLLEKRMSSVKLMALLASITAFAMLGVAVACSSPDPTATPVPTATPAPTATTVPTATPAPETSDVVATTSSSPDPTATPASTATPVPTATPAPTATTVPTATPVPEKINIVATTSIIADWIREVGGDRVTVRELVPRLSDPHNFQPGARDVAAVADADLVFVNGLDLEGQWLVDLVRNAAPDSNTVVDLSDGVSVIPYGEEDDHADEDHDDHADEDGHDEDGDDHAHDEDGDDHADEDGDDHAHDEDGDDHADEDGDDHAHDEDGDDHADEDGDDHAHDEDGDDHADEGGHHDHAHGEFDPHFWMSPVVVKEAVHTIEERLSEIAPASASLFHERAEAYTAKLDELDTWIVERVATIPAHDKLLVTTHDALGYFADRYGFRIVGTVLPGGGTQIAPSPTELAELAELITTLGIGVVFTEAQLSDALTITLAQEAGASVVRGLVPGSLGLEGTPSGTYLGMMRHNVEVIVGGLSGA